VAFNAAVAAGAVAAHLRDRRSLQRTPADAEPAPSPVANRTSLPLGIVLAMSFVGGLVSLSYEIFFFRAMSYASASSSFAFAMTLGAFLIGLASGARLGSEACVGSAGDALMRRMLR